MFKGNNQLIRVFSVLSLASLLFACDDDARDRKDSKEGESAVEDLVTELTEGEEVNEAEVLRRVIDETMDVTTIVFGQARDHQNRSLEGVTVKMLGDQLYEATTDANGYFRFDDVTIGSARALIGMAATSSGNNGTTNATMNVQATYELMFSHEGMATNIVPVNLMATVYRTPNSYAYETTPWSFNGTLLPFANATIKLLTGEANADGSPIVASGAQVEIRPIPNQEADQFDTVTVRTQANAEGKVEVTAEHKLAAARGYRIIVFPYDVDPAAGNGFEYDTVLQDVDLSPYSYFNEASNGAFHAGDIIITLADGIARNAAPRIAFSDPSEGSSLAPADSIRLVFSRPVDVSTVRYSVHGCSNVGCDGTTSMLLTNELSVTPLEVNFQLSDAHPHIFRGFRVNLTAQTLDNRPLNAVIDYTVDDSVRPLDIAVPTPVLNVEAVDGTTSEEYYTAVDAASIFVSDRVQFDAESYRGSIFSSINGALTPAWGGTGIDRGLDLRFRATPGAVGYRIFLKDSHRTTNWMQVANIAASQHQTADNDWVLATADLSTYLNLYNDGLVSPFCCGNVVQLAVLPYFAESDGNGAIDNTRMAAIDPNAVLSLTDNFGPSIFPQGGEIFGSPTMFSGLDYDEMATIAFSERMSNMPAAQVESLEVTGRFAIGFAQWEVADNYATWRVQLDPTFVSASELFIGDKIRTVDSESCMVDKIDLCDGRRFVRCGGTVYEAADYELLGPVRDEEMFYDEDGDARFSLRDGVQPGNVFYASDFLDMTGRAHRFFMTADNDVRWSILVGNESYPVRPRLGSQTIEERRVALREPFRVALDLNAQAVTLSNQANLTLVNEVTVAAEGTRESVNLVLNRLDGVTLNQVVTLMDDDATKTERVQILAINQATSSVTVNASHSHAAGTRLALHYAGITRAPGVFAGADTVDLANQNGVLNTWIDPNGNCANGGCYQVTITAPDGDVQTALVTRVQGNTLTLNGDLTNNETRGVNKDIPEGSVIELVAHSVALEQVVVSLNRLDGVRANATLNVTIGQGSQAASNTGSYTACAVESNGEAFLTTNDQLASVTGADAVLPFAEGDLRPMDKIKVLSAADAAGNAIRVEGDELLGNGEVE